MDYSKILPVAIRPLAVDDVTHVLRSVGPVVDALYPRGKALLGARLEQVLERKARCTVAWRKNVPVGVAVETFKGFGRVKLSTLWVHPLYRRQAIGSQLLAVASQKWFRAELTRVHLTVRLSAYDGIYGLLSQFGFEHLTIERDRYGDGNDEAILIWTPDAAEAPFANQRSLDLSSIIVPTSLHVVA